MGSIQAVNEMGKIDDAKTLADAKIIARAYEIQQHGETIIKHVDDGWEERYEIWEA